MAKLKILTGRIEPAYRLPTGSVGLNRALNGTGLVGGRIHVYWGPKASGKTTQALFSIAEAQSMGKVCLYIDAEKTFNTEWAERCGVDVDKLLYIRSNTVEDICEAVVPLVEKGEIDVVVLDSLSSVFGKAFIEKPESGGGMGFGARSANFFTSKMLTAIGWDTQIIIIAHANMGTTGGGSMFSLQAKISKSVEHWASTIIRFYVSMAKDNVKEDGARLVTWRVDKSKQSPYPVTGDYWISTKTPYVFIDKAEEIASLCRDLQIVEGSNWLSYEGTKWHGKDKFAAALKEDHDLYKMFEAKVNEYAVEVAPEDEGDTDEE